MNWRGWSGGHEKFKRRDGEEVLDERGFNQDKDALLKWALFLISSSALGFLYYINNCQQQILKSQSDIQASIAVLMERTTTIRAEMDGLKTNQSYMQSEIDTLRSDYKGR